MKLHASCTPFESLPGSVWQNFRRAVQSAANDWGIPLEITEDLTVREAEQRFTAWLSRPTNDVE